MPVSVNKNTGLMSLSEAVVVGISGSAVPGVSRDRILEMYGPVDGPVVFDEVVALVREAVAMPIEWGTMSLAEGTPQKPLQPHPRPTPAAPTPRTPAQPGRTDETPGSRADHLHCHPTHRPISNNASRDSSGCTPLNLAIMSFTPGGWSGRHGGEAAGGACGGLLAGGAGSVEPTMRRGLPKMPERRAFWCAGHQAAPAGHG